MKNLTPEIINKAKTAKSAEEILELAKANGVEITEEEAKAYFAQLNANGAVADDELDAVAGGGSCPESSDYALTAKDIPAGTRVEVLNGKCCPKCGSTNGITKLLVPNHTDPSCPLVIACEKCQESFLHPVIKTDIRVIL